MILQAGGPAQLFQAVHLLTSEGQNKFSCLLQLHLHFPRVFFWIKVQFISFITIQSLFLNHYDQRTKFKLFTSDVYANVLQNRNASGQDNQKKTFFFFFFYRILKFIIKEQIKCLNKKKKHVSGRLITEFKNTHPEVVVSQAVHVKLQRLLTDEPHPFTSEAGGATHQRTLGRVQTHMFHTLLDLSHVEPLVTGARQHCKDRWRTLCQTHTLKKSWRTFSRFIMMLFFQPASQWIFLNFFLMLWTSCSVSPIGSSGWKATSLTEPAWPGSLYSIRRDVVSQI